MFHLVDRESGAVRAKQHGVEGPGRGRSEAIPRRELGRAHPNLVIETKVQFELAIPNSCRPTPENLQI